MLDKRTPDKINNRPQGGGRPVAYAMLGAVAVALLSTLLSYALAATVLMVGVAIVFLLYKRDAATRITRLADDLDTGMTFRFAVVQAACEALSSAKKVWRVEGEAQGRRETSFDGEALSFGGGISFRSPAEVDILDEAPGISANVEIWGTKIDLVSLFFLSECVLSYKEDRYRAVSCDSFGVAYYPSRTTEDEEAPKDTEVLGET